MTMTSEEYARMVKRCLRCSICKWIPQVQIKNAKHATICPSMDYYNFHAYSGGGKLILANSIETGRIPLSETVRDIVYKCTACGGCSVSCKHLNTLEPLEVIQLLREKLVASGVGPMPRQQEYIDAIKRTGNPYDEPASQRMNWLPDDVKTHDDADIAYFVGCTSSYRRKEIAIATARVLNAAGTRFKLFGSNESCCGSPVLRAGDVESFKELVGRNIDMFTASGVKKIIASCAGCYDMFKVEYPRFEKMPVDIVSASEYFNELIDGGKLVFKDQEPITVTYHDPCHLGRGAEPYIDWDGDVVQMLPMVSLNVPEKPKRCGAGGVYEAPRRVITRLPGVQLVEMDRIKEYSYCCGAGGGVKSAFPDFALHTGQTRITEAESTGATCIVSACPFCSSNLQDAITESKSQLQYKDIAELIYDSIDPSMSGQNNE
ncbi:MAG TPA: (Fe-S)-binding protein [Candidatus Lokiarchaeia archaeon]|nr:(Fe-S)-binding protein [Candidatus Lokiarchaeia archaeon]